MPPNLSNKGSAVRVCVLSSSYAGSQSDTAGLDPERAPSLYDKDGKYEWHAISVPKAKAVATVRDAADSGKYDVFLNLCDGAFDEDRAGIEVVQALERCNCVYTGADLAFYEPTKDLMKAAVSAYGVKVPAWALIKAGEREQLAESVCHLRYPLIVKHYSGYNSVGMGRDAKCATFAELEVQADKFLTMFGGALIEEFIEGREFTVMVVEGQGLKAAPFAYPPIESKFAEGETFKHFDLKWKDYESMGWIQCSDTKLCEDLRKAACDSFLALRGCSYGRVDFRVDMEGNIFFLEINPNCGVFYPPDAMGSADFVLDWDAKAGGGGHAGFIDRIIAAAQARAASRVKGAAVRYLPAMRGYGLIATRDFEPGEVIVQYEERPHYLVSKKFADKKYPPGSLEREWFAAYAYPISDETWVIWSPDPADWLPINHACDPSAWVDGLDLVAKRSVAKGESINIEYATFNGPTMASFDCACGAANCRGRVDQSDYTLPWMEQYEGHMTDYVAAKRELARAKGLLKASNGLASPSPTPSSCSSHDMPAASGVH